MPPASGRLPYKDFLTLWKAADPDIPILNTSQAVYLPSGLTPATRVGE